MYGSKMNCAFVFASHKGLACILKTFVHISFGLHFKNNVGFHILHFKASKYIYSLKCEFDKTNQIKFLDLISYQ